MNRRVQRKPQSSPLVCVLLSSNDNVSELLALSLQNTGFHGTGWYHGQSVYLLTEETERPRQYFWFWISSEREISVLSMIRRTVKNPELHRRTWWKAAGTAAKSSKVLLLMEVGSPLKIRG